jgi:hypothetical protein
VLSIAERKAVISISVIFVSSLLLAGLTLAQVKSHQKISFTKSGFTGTLDPVDVFGMRQLGRLDDWDGNGVADLAVPAPGDDDGGQPRRCLDPVRRSEPTA